MNKLYLPAKLRISKNFIEKLATAKAEYYNYNANTIEPEFKDYNNCKACPFKDNPDFKYVCDNCVFVLSNSSISKTRNRHELSESQIKQLLLYYTLVFENNKITAPVTIEEVAEFIGTTKKTVYNNLDTLEKDKFIVINKFKGGVHQVLILDYPTYNKDKSNNEPYMYISKECLQNLMKIKNINALRLALIMLLKIDNMKAVKKTIKTISYSYLNNILPSYIHTNKQVKELLNSLTSIFKITSDNPEDDELSYEQNQETIYITQDSITPDKMEHESEYFNEYFKKYGKTLSNMTMRDILQMCDQYGFTLVKEAIKAGKEKIISMIPDRIEYANDIGAYVRAIIKNQYRSVVSNLMR